MATLPNKTSSFAHFDRPKRPPNYRPPTNAEELRERLAGGEQYFAHAELRRADLRGVDLRYCNLDHSDFESADLTGATLGSKSPIRTGGDIALTDGDVASMNHASFINAKLNEANLIGAWLIGANFRYTSLVNADFRAAHITQAFFHSSNLTGADFRHAMIGDTDFVEIDLSTCLLTDIAFFGRSNPSYFTLLETAEGIERRPETRTMVESFLRLIALDDIGLEFFRALAVTPIQIYDAFISYDHRDRGLVRRFYDALAGHDVRCWLDERDIAPGEDLYEAIDHGIRLCKRLLLACSRDSLNSWWVEKEIYAALERERELHHVGHNISCILPLDLDGYLFSPECSSKIGHILRSRYAVDFSDPDNFDAGVARVAAALRKQRIP